ncbi:hypothetical protein POVWA2_035410 [Plasmodium ovale wallikeri]|uniref:Secreted protein n=1 Tax=Plasmodium ovale wallikeri TaxID=864142 RepID=A0A1A8Z3F4_PLAOA|nr:hypothetical protein POVWA1_036120 [Plasmodium ovale wallikeri]SBT38304.1 hypothetical protein POVWA2_035410 [Plasmodium ovale wallikeri]
MFSFCACVFFFQFFQGSLHVSFHPNIGSNARGGLNLSRKRKNFSISIRATFSDVTAMAIPTSRQVSSYWQRRSDYAQFQNGLPKMKEEHGMECG